MLLALGGCSSSESTLNTLQPTTAAATAAAAQLCATNGACGNEALAGMKATYDAVPANNAALATGYDSDNNGNIDMCFYEGTYNVPKACTLQGFASDGSTAETTIDVGDQLPSVCAAGNTVMTYTVIRFQASQPFLKYCLPVSQSIRPSIKSPSGSSKRSFLVGTS